MAEVRTKPVIPRELTYSTQVTISHHTAWYIDKSGLLDMEKLLTVFQAFFRENSEIWLKRFDYREAGPQLLLQAFLQRVINSGGRIDREYGLGTGRTDLLIHWKHDKGIQKVVVELKILYKSLKKTIDEGLVQTAQYMDRSGTGDGRPAVFNRNPKKKMERKDFLQEGKIWR